MVLRSKPPVCVVVADQSEARVYLLRGAAMRLSASLDHPAARKHDRDLKSDRPGRVYDRAPPARGRRGAMAHHATGGERTPRRQSATVFARQIAAAVAENTRTARVDCIVLVAPPRFLGMLRRTLPATLRAQVAAATLRARVAAAAGRALRPR